MLKLIYLYKTLCLFLLCALLSAGRADFLLAQDVSQEYQLKAAFLVNFPRFITWPEQSFSPGQQEITFCIAGKNPFGTTLNAFENKMINGRHIKVVYAESSQGLPPCHLLFVGKSEGVDLRFLLLSLNKKNVVTVGDTPGFVDAGGSIEFVIKDEHLSFIINNSGLKQHGIQVGSSMLDLAASVQ
jgi:hypothetical protein